MLNCSRCGTTTEESDANAWSFATSTRGIEWMCRDCTRQNVRAIEAKLPEEWWE